MDLYDLRQHVELALEMVDADATVVAAEVCTSWCEYQTVSVQYDADHPTDGVQTPQVFTTFGIGFLVVVEAPDGRRVGFGSEPDDLTLDGMTLTMTGETPIVVTTGSLVVPSKLARWGTVSCLSSRRSSMVSATPSIVRN